jgi:uncharacterized membrane protein SirB2
VSYAFIKLVHLSTAAASFGLFFVRGVWMLYAPQRLRERWVRIVPHLIDSLLLGSAIALAVLSRQYPGADNWLSAKVIALLAYIALGMVALKRGRTRRIRVFAWLAALAIFAYIVAVARTRSTWPIW